MFVPEVLLNQSLRFLDSSDKDMRYELLPSENTVLILRRTKGREGTTIRLVTEVLLELRKGMPSGETVNAKEWVPSGLLRYGSRVLEYESKRFEGTVMVDGGAANPVGGQVTLVFLSPARDILGVGNVPLQAKF
jgi:hypothetical protein